MHVLRALIICVVAVQATGCCGGAPEWPAEPVGAPRALRASAIIGGSDVARFAPECNAGFGAETIWIVGELEELHETREDFEAYFEARTVDDVRVERLAFAEAIRLPDTATLLCLIDTFSAEEGPDTDERLWALAPRSPCAEIPAGVDARFDMRSQPDVEARVQGLPPGTILHHVEADCVSGLSPGACVNGFCPLLCSAHFAPLF